MIEIPQNNQWVQTNRSDVLGNLVGTLNVDFTKVLGNTRVNRMIQTTSQNNGSAPNASLTSYPVGFQIFNSKIWTVAGAKAHQSGTVTANSSFVVDATSGTPTDCDSTQSDILVTTLGGTGYLFVTANSKLYYVTSGSWSNTSFTGDGPWMMTAYASRLYFTVSGLSKIYSTVDGPTIVSSSDYSLTLGTNFIPTVMRASSNRIWIGTIAKNGKGYVFEWDGVSTQPTREYRLESQGVCSMVIKDDVPYIMDTNGRLQVYYNGTFKELARLPTDDKFFLKATDTVNDRYIHPNGMSVCNGKINILINNKLDDSAGSIPEFCPSGIWEYDEKIGLYHKYSASYLPVSQNSVTDYGQIRVSGVGALSEMKLQNSASNATGDLMAGMTVYTDATTTDVGIFTNDTFDAVTGTYHANEACGHIVTTKIESSQIKDVWQRLVAFYERFKTSTDKITVKKRSYVQNPTEITITWVDTSSFTTTSNVLGLEGYEVQVIQGTGSSKTAHITRIDNHNTYYTVTLDDTFTGVTGTAKAVIQRWIKCGEISNQTSQHQQVNLDETSEYIQLKIAFQFTGKNEFNKMILVNKVSQLLD